MFVDPSVTQTKALKRGSLLITFFRHAFLFRVVCKAHVYTLRICEVVVIVVVVVVVVVVGACQQPRIDFVKKLI
jgi:hypothetical protein